MGIQLDGINNEIKSQTKIDFPGSVGVAGTLTYEDVTNVDSVGVITARSGINISSGSLTIPDSIIHSGDTNTKIRFPADDTITAETGGSERFRINSSGSVSIGNNPTVHADTIFHIEDSGETNIKIEGSTSTLGARISLQNNDTTANAYSQYAFNDAGGQSTSAIQGINTDQTNNYGELAFLTRNAQGLPPQERMRISKEGYVTNPARPCFDVAKDDGAVSSTNAIVFNVVNVNNGSHYNTSNGRFTAPVTGTYFLYFGGIKANNNNVVRLKLLKNGTGNYMNADRELRIDDGDAYGENASMNVVVSLTANDYVQVYVTAGTIYGTDASYTHFGGYLLS